MDSNHPSEDQEVSRGTVLTYERFRVTKRPDAAWIRSEWNNDGNQRLLRSEELRVVDYREGSSAGRLIDFDRLPDQAQRTFADSAFTETAHFLPYDEAVFSGIESIGMQVSQLEQRLSKVIATDKGREAIARHVLQLLPERRT